MASEIALGKLTAELNNENSKRAEKLPGFSGMVGMFASVLTGNQLLVKEVSKSYQEYSDIFQMKQS